MVIKFKKEQMTAWVDNDEAFADWYVDDFMLKNLPDFYYSVSAQGKREMTINGRAYARQFGFADGESQAHFVTFMWAIGANFFTHPGFSEIANDKDLSGSEKVDRFYAVPKDKAVHAIMNPDDRYWYPEMVEPARSR